MASLPIKPLNGRGGYLRWKESLLLRAHTLGVAHVLFDARPAGGDDAAAKKWAVDDGVCRGHILATISDRLLPDYARFATAAEVWRALERTYDYDLKVAAIGRLRDFRFDQSTGEVFLEQLAHAEALGLATGFGDAHVACFLRDMLPPAVSRAVIARSHGEERMDMGLVWDCARRAAAVGGASPRLQKLFGGLATDGGSSSSNGRGRRGLDCSWFMAYGSGRLWIFFLPC